MKKSKKDTNEVQKEIGIELMKKNVCLLRNEFESLDEWVHEFVTKYIEKTTLIESLILSLKRGLCPEKFEIIHNPIDAFEETHDISFKPIIKPKKIKRNKKCKSA